MHSAAQKIRDLPAVRPDDYLGPGHVVAVMPHEVEVEIRGGERVHAQMALSIPYEPNEGDVLLVIGKGDEHYVIGVIRGTGKTSLAFQGAVDLSATGGPLTLSSDRGVAIHGPEMEIQTGKLQVFAGAVVEKLGSLYQRVSAMWSVRAEEAEMVVDKGSLTRAKSATILTEETMTINGKQIHLG
jgi:hypothetical protein